MTKETQTIQAPVQSNTKIISCRISYQDYVSFLNEAILKGITINDWLLLKVYNNNDNKALTDFKNISGYDKMLLDEENIKGNNFISFKKGSFEKTHQIEFPLIITDETNEEYNFNDVSDIEDFINQCKEVQLELFDKLNRREVEMKLAKFDDNFINLNDKGDRAIIENKLIKYINDEYDNGPDKKALKKDVRELFMELFDQI